MTRPQAAATRRTRGSWTPRIAGIAIAVLVACAAAVGYAVASPTGPTRPAAQLSSRVSSVQTVGIVGQAGGALGDAAATRMLGAQGGRLLFTPVPAADLPQGDPQWTVDTMADGTYIFIYAPTGSCLAAAGPARLSAPALRRCDLGPEQRWRPLSSTLESGGHQYGQYRNLRTGRCLALSGSAASGASPAPPALVTCSTGSPVRQLVSFYWGAGT